MSKRLETPSERPILSIRDRVQGFDVTAENNKYLLSMIRPAALHEARRQAEEVSTTSYLKLNFAEPNTQKMLAFDLFNRICRLLAR